MLRFPEWKVSLLSFQNLRRKGLCHKIRVGGRRSEVEATASDPGNGGAAGNNMKAIVIHLPLAGFPISHCFRDQATGAMGECMCS